MIDMESSWAETSVLNWRNARRAGGAVLAAVVFATGARSLVDDDYPECGSVVRVDTDSSPSAFLTHEDETYSLYMPESYISKQQVTIVSGDIEGERAASEPVILKMDFAKSSDIQHAVTQLPDGGGRIVLEYDKATNLLKTDCS